MGDEAHDVEPGDALLCEDEGRVRLGLAKDRDEHVLPVDLLLAGGLYMRGGSLNDPLEAQRLLQRALLSLGEGFDLFVEVALHLFLEGGHVSPTVPKDFEDFGVVQQRVEDVLDRKKLVTSLARLVYGEGKGLLELSADSHGFSVRFAGAVVTPPRRYIAVESRAPGRGCGLGTRVSRRSRRYKRPRRQSLFDGRAT